MAERTDRDTERLCELLAPKFGKQLGPGIHGTRSGPYKWEHGGRTVHVIPTGVSSPLANPDDPAYQVFLDLFLENVRGNSSIPDSYVELLISAIIAVSPITPDAMGLVGSAGYSGPGATALDRTLRHRTRGDSFAAELIVAAELITSPSLAGNGDSTLSIDPRQDRVDFGVKLQARKQGESVGRKTVEADVFITKPKRAVAVDVKHTRNSGTYSGHISRQQLDGVVSVIESQEIHEFHFVTNGRFGPKSRDAINMANGRCELERIYWHEAVWPSETCDPTETSDAKQ